MANITNFFDEKDIFFETPDLPTTPNHTLLNGLNPLEVGSGSTESIISYILRLADSHRTSPTTLMKEVLINKLVIRNNFWASDRASKLKDISSFMTPGKVTEGLITVLHEVTGVDGLECCTMLPIRNILAPRDLFASHERHCTLCLNETNKTENLYGRLLWEIACVNSCPIHKIRLIPSTCGAPKDSHLKLFNRKILAGVCSSCGSIGYQCKEDMPIKATNVEDWKATQVAELISCFPSASQLFSKCNLVKGISASVASCGDGIPAEVARKAGISKSLLWGWMHGINQPTIGHLLQLCLATTVSLVSLLKGHPVECLCPLPEKIAPKQHTKKPTGEERESALKTALVAEPPQSLNTIAASLGLTRKTLRIEFPELFKQASERYQQFALSKTEERDRQIKEIGQRAIDELTAKGRPITFRNFQDVIGKALMPKSRLRIFFNTAHANREK